MTDRWTHYDWSMRICYTHYDWSMRICCAHYDWSMRIRYTYYDWSMRICYTYYDWSMRICYTYYDWSIRIGKSNSWSEHICRPVLQHVCIPSIVIWNFIGSSTLHFKLTVPSLRALENLFNFCVCSIDDGNKFPLGVNRELGNRPVNCYTGRALEAHSTGTLLSIVIERLSIIWFL